MYQYKVIYVFSIYNESYTLIKNKSFLIKSNNYTPFFYNLVYYIIIFEFKNIKINI